MGALSPKKLGRCSDSYSAILAVSVRRKIYEAQNTETPAPDTRNYSVVYIVCVHAGFSARDGVDF